MTDSSNSKSCSAPAARYDCQPVPSAQLWTGRVLTTLVVLFLLLDAAVRLIVPPLVVQDSVHLGFPVHLNPVLGVILLVVTPLYVIPRTALLGAVLLTSFLGGAVAILMRAGSPLFMELLPVLFGVFVWAGLLLRDAQLRVVFPLRRA